LFPLGFRTDCSLRGGRNGRPVVVPVALIPEVTGFPGYRKSR